MPSLPSKGEKDGEPRQRRETLPDKIAKGIGAGIGLYSEWSIHKKELKEKEKAEKEAQSPVSPSSLGPGLAEALASVTRTASAPTTFVPAPGRSASFPKPNSKDIDVVEVEDDEAEWALDEAAQTVRSSTWSKVVKPPEGNWEGPENVKVLVKSFMDAHPLSENVTLSTKPMEKPVIIPQRRPKWKDRGFIRCYSPVLADYGIDQPTFLGFLEYFDEAFRTTNVLEVVNVASMATGFVPTLTTQLVSAALQIVYFRGKDGLMKNRQNDFLSRINAQFFQPRGLFCLVMTYLPDEHQRTKYINVSSICNKDQISSVIDKRINEASSSSTKKFIKTLRASDGQTRGEFQMPEAAELAFPSIDHATIEEQKKFRGFVRDYLDRRAHAKYAKENPESILAMETSFKSPIGAPGSINNVRELGSYLTNGWINKEYADSSVARGPFGILSIGKSKKDEGGEERERREGSDGDGKAEDEKEEGDVIDYEERRRHGGRRLARRQERTRYNSYDGERDYKIKKTQTTVSAVSVSRFPALRSAMESMKISTTSQSQQAQQAHDNPLENLSTTRSNDQHAAAPADSITKEAQLENTLDDPHEIIRPRMDANRNPIPPNYPLDKYATREAKKVPKKKGPFEVIKRAIGENVLYLMITTLPSKEELQEASDLLDQQAPEQITNEERDQVESVLAAWPRSGAGLDSPSVS